MTPDELGAEIMRIGAEGFERGHEAAMAQLAEPITAVWLAQATGVSVERAGDVLTDLRALLTYQQGDERRG